jgi:hypothetical protein
MSSYVLGLPLALVSGIVANLGAGSVFGSKALEEVVKVFILYLWTTGCTPFAKSTMSIAAR